MTPQLYTDSYFPLTCPSNAKSNINFDPLSNLHQVFLKKTLCQLRIRIFISDDSPIQGWLLLPFDFVKTIQKGNLNFDSQCNLQQDFLKKTLCQLRIIISISDDSPIQGWLLLPFDFWLCQSKTKEQPKLWLLVQFATRFFKKKLFVNSGS